MEDNSVDIVLSSLVLFELPDKEKMKSYFEEALRVLRPGGIMLALTGSENIYLPQRKFVSFTYLAVDEKNDPFNANLKSGDQVEVHLFDADMYIQDYFWTNEVPIFIIKSLFLEGGTKYMYKYIVIRALRLIKVLMNYSNFL